MSSRIFLIDLKIRLNQDIGGDWKLEDCPINNFKIVSGNLQVSYWDFAKTFLVEGCGIADVCRTHEEVLSKLKHHQQTYIDASIALNNWVKTFKI